jgi:hypothetical protein
MSNKWILCGAALALATIASAKEHELEKGTLVKMDSSNCSAETNKKTHELTCQEYILQADHVVYHIRPKDLKHPVLLPVGELAEFRVDKDKLLLVVPELDTKEREYIVVSTTPRDTTPPTTTSASKN